MKKILFAILLLNLNFCEAKTLIISKNAQLKNLNKYILTDIFTGQKQKWDNGEKITVFIKPVKTLEHKDFTYSILGISPTKFNELLNAKNKRVFNVSSDEEMIMKILQTPGSIGYVNYYENFDKDVIFLD